MISVLGGRSIKLARVFGVRVGVDASWFVVLFLVIFILSRQLNRAFPTGGEALPFALAVITALLFFASVVVHELGHAVVARRNGISIAGIDLWLFGGVAKMRGEPRSPGVDFRIAAAGPLVTLVVVLVSVGGGLALEGVGGFGAGLDLRPKGNGVGPAASVVLGYLAQINALLLIFNLLPGLPLDGGRIARAIAWKVTGDRPRATRIAAGLGRGFSFLLIGAGLFVALRVDLIAGVWLALIGLFIGQAARAAVAQSALTAGIEQLEVKDVMDAEPVSAPADGSVAQAYEELFLRYGWDWFPVVDGDGHFVGLLAREDVEAVPEDDRPQRRTADLVREGSAQTFGVRTDEPLDALLASESLRRLGAVMAVDGEGVLRGVLTLEHLRRALQPAA